MVHKHKRRSPVFTGNVSMKKLICMVLVFALITISCMMACAEEVLDESIPSEDAEMEQWTHILLLGADSRSTTDNRGRTDSMVILSVNMQKSEVKMTSIMRDTWLHVDGFGYQKINAANVFGGPQLAIDTVNEHFGTNIDKYALVNMYSLANIIDSVGGVYLSVSESERKLINQQVEYDQAEFKFKDASKLKKSGSNVHLTGSQALAYARIRKLDSDYVRTQRQRNVLIAIANELKNENLMSIFSVISTLANYVETNLSMNDMIELATMGFSIDMDSIEQLRLPADGTFESGMSKGTWSIRPNFEKNAQIWKDFILYGLPEEAED